MQNNLFPIDNGYESPTFHIRGGNLPPADQQEQDNVFKIIAGDLAEPRFADTAPVPEVNASPEQRLQPEVLNRIARHIIEGRRELLDAA